MWAEEEKTNKNYLVIPARWFMRSHPRPNALMQAVRAELSRLQVYFEFVYCSKKKKKIWTFKFIQLYESQYGVQ